MAQPITTELKVGLFVVVAVAILVLGYVFTRDGLRAGERAYRVQVVAPSAEGLYEGTPVRLAGVNIGVVDDIALSGDRAMLTLAIRSQYQLPVDSQVEVRSSGLLGDRFVGIDLGRSGVIVADGGVLAFGREPGDIDAITRQVDQITLDVEAITGVLREIVEDRENRENVEQGIENFRVLSAELRMIAQENRHDVNAIVDSVRRLAESLEGFSREARADVRTEMEKLHDATDRLDDSLQNVQSITRKIDEGEGTLGMLVNDPETVTLLNEVIEDAGGLVGGFARLRAEVYYTGRFYFGTQPDPDLYFYGNPLAPNLAGGLGFSGSNTIGILLKPQEDFWWIFEFNDYPQGSIEAEQHYFPEQGVAWTQYVRRLNYRMTFQMSKRWWDLSLRLGIKEGGGGVGLTWYTLNDRVQVMADVFDFTFGSYPVIEDRGIPNVRLGVRATPISNVWAEAGAEQVIMGVRHGYATGYVGGGFHFTDDDIKMLFAFLPIRF